MIILEVTIIITAAAAAATCLDGTAGALQELGHMILGCRRCATGTGSLKQC
jgi:hypothetical protein